MKLTKKIVSILLALSLVLALATTAFAATVTVEQTGHTYKAYQILTGTQAESEGALGDVAWGSGINAEAFLAALKAENSPVKETFKDATNAQTFAEAMATLTTNSDGAKAVAEIADANKAGEGIALDEGKNTLEDGYYLIVDVTDITGHDSKNASLLEVTRDITIADKSAKPTVDKQVHDEPEDAENGANDGWGETADHNMNETFQFKLTATLPADQDFEAYETYKVVFNDTMSDSVTFDGIVSVKVNDTVLAADAYTCTATVGQEGGSWTLTINDIMQYDNNLTDGAVIEVIYNAHLNEKAVIGNKDDNKNTVYLEYSNNPNVGGEGELGKTTDDTVWVFTYEMPNTKVGKTGDAEAPLKDAGFRLYADEACTTEIALIYDESLKAYRPVKDGETGVEMKSDAEGLFNIKGLDVGTYYLKETTTPAGYNTCPVVKVVITATHAENADGTTATTTITMTQDGVDTDVNKIVNKAGTILPETGGIGTTLFYVIGGLLVAGAVVLLVTKKRMSTAA